MTRKIPIGTISSSQARRSLVHTPVKSATLLRRKHAALKRFGINSIFVGDNTIANGSNKVSQTIPPLVIREISDERFPSNEEMISEMAESIIDSFSMTIQCPFDRKARGAKRVESVVKIDGCNRIGLSEEFMSVYLGALPKSWTRSTTDNIVSFTPHYSPMSSLVFEGRFESAHCAVSLSGSSEIVITTTDFVGPDARMNAKMRDFLLSNILLHEFIHANDWRNPDQFDTQQSLELQYMVYKAVVSKGRPQFDKTESIEQKNQSGFVEERCTMGQIDKYFAELIKHALIASYSIARKPSWKTWMRGFAASLEQNYLATSEEAMKNAKLITWYFLHVDPSFKPWEASEHLKILRSELKRVSVIDELAPLLEEVGDPILSRACKEYLRTESIPRRSHSTQTLTRATIRSEFSSPRISAANRYWMQVASALRLLSFCRSDNVWSFDMKQVSAPYIDFVKQWEGLDNVQRGYLRPVLLDELDEIYCNVDATT